jgi:hypothetical protein
VKEVEYELNGKKYLELDFSIILEVLKFEINIPKYVWVKKM